jgi:hypothetical protein
VTVALQIDAIVLDGLQLHPREAARFHRLVEGELARLIARDGLAPQHRLAGAVPAVRAPDVTMAARTDTAALARQVSRSVARGLRR